jgi:hypothetical protein
VWIAVGCGLTAIVVLLAGAIGSLSMFELQTISLNRTAVFEVAEPGDWVLASESHATIDGQRLTGIDLAAADVSLTDPMGTRVSLQTPDRDTTYAMPDRAGRIIATFHAGHAGPWTIDRTQSGDDTAIVAVGPDPALAMIWWVLVPGAVAIVLLGVAAGCVWVAWRTKHRAYT